MARWEREGVVVDYPDGMDYPTLEHIVRSILVEAEEALRPKPPKKEPLPDVGFRSPFEMPPPKKT
jgi:hypothetical protein